MNKNGLTALAIVGLLASGGVSYALVHNSNNKQAERTSMQMKANEAASMKKEDEAKAMKKTDDASMMKKDEDAKMSADAAMQKTDDAMQKPAGDAMTR